MTENKKTIPIFRSSGGSVGCSILTADKAKEEIKEGEQVSIPTIAKIHDIDPVLVIDNDFTFFPELFKNLSAINKTLYFGISLIVCDDIDDKSQDSLHTEHKINILLKNENGESSLIQLFNKASRDGFYYRPRIDIENLKRFWSDDLKLCIPFFDSFIYNNSLVQRANIVPDFSFTKPTFFLEKHELPFVDCIRERVIGYCNSYDLTTQPTHSVYHYRRKDVGALMALKCIRKRTHMEKPNLDGFSTDDFCFEAFLEGLEGNK